MSRRIVTTKYEAAGGAPVDSYFDKIVKYIPADVVGAWLAATGLIDSSADGHKQHVLLWIVFLVGLPLSAAWTLKRTHEPGKPLAVTQTVVATLSFAIWVFATGGPFATLSWYDSLYGGLILIGYMAAIGLVTPPE